MLSLHFVEAFPFIQSESGFTYLNVRLFAVLATSMIGVVAIHLIYYAVSYAYHGIYDLSSLRKHFARVLIMLFLDMLMIYTLQLVFSSTRLPILFFIYYLSISFSLIVLLNLISKFLISRYIRKKNSFINLLIIGTNKHAYGFYNLVNSNKFLGYNVIGFLDDNNFGGYSIDLISDLQGFKKVVRDNVVDCSVIFLPIRSYPNQILNIITVAEDQGIALQLMNNIFDTRRGYVSTTRMGDYSGLLFDVLPPDEWRLLVKRFFDVGFSVALLICTSPLVLVAVIAIKMHDRGPVIFKQKRVGYHKRIFMLYKLRTMKLNAEALQEGLEYSNEMDGPVFKIKNDPRITSVGRWLRRYGIDELPQLVNVIKGDMSIVGPRPLAMRDYNGFSEDWLQRRFSVRPGLTCYWQSKPNRNDLSFHEWMQLDMQYIDKWNLLEDAKILAQTIPAVLSGTGR